MFFGDRVFRVTSFTDRGRTVAQFSPPPPPANTTVGFILSGLTVVNDLRRFLSRFSSNCHAILQALLTIDVRFWRSKSVFALKD